MYVLHLLANPLSNYIDDISKENECTTLWIKTGLVTFSLVTYGAIVYEGLCIKDMLSPPTSTAVQTIGDTFSGNLKIQ